MRWPEERRETRPERRRVGARAVQLAVARVDGEADMSGCGRTCPVAAGTNLLGFAREFWGRNLYIEVEGARSVQMGCGFRPHDRDPTTESMEGKFAGFWASLEGVWGCKQKRLNPI